MNVTQCSLNDDQCSLTEAQCSLKNAQCSLNDAQCSLNDAQCSLTDAQWSLNNAQCYLNGAQCSLENAQSSLNDALRSLNDAHHGLVTWMEEKDTYYRCYMCHLFFEWFFGLTCTIFLLTALDLPGWRRRICTTTQLFTQRMPVFSVLHATLFDIAVVPHHT